MSDIVPSSHTAAEGGEDTIKAAVFQRLHPRVYLERFLQENIRPDGRAPNIWRDIFINVGSISTANGSALVRWGDTTIVCGVKAEIAEPELDRPNDGFIVPNIDLPAICSPKFKPGPPHEDAQILSNRLNEIISSANPLDSSQLCISPGKAVWALYIDAICINYDGNALDATITAIVSALRNTQLPKAIYDEDSGRTICSRNSRIPLSLGRLPISFSGGVFNSTHLLVDPTSFEEPLLDATITVTLDQEENLLCITQAGLASAGEFVTEKMITMAKAQARLLKQKQLLTI